MKRIDFNLRPIATTLPLSALPANDDNADDDADDNGVYDDDDAADDDSDDDDFVQVQSDKHEPVFLGSPRRLHRPSSSSFLPHQHTKGSFVTIFFKT